MSLLHHRERTKEYRYAPLTQRGNATVSGLALFVLAGLLASACSSGDVGNEPGIESVPQIELVEIFRLGEETSPDSVVFGSVSDLAVNSAGQVFVGEWQDPKIYVYSDAGALMTTIGSKGKGPGEFTYGPQIAISRNDSIFALDIGAAGRVSVFQPEDFRLARTIPIATKDLEYPADILGVANGGILVNFRMSYGPNVSTEHRREVVRLLDYQGTVRRDSVLVMAEDEALVLRESGSMMVTSMPFGRASIVRLGSNGYLYHGWNETIDLAIRDLRGAKHDSIQYHAPRNPVTEQAASAVLEEIPERWQTAAKQKNLHDTWPAYGSFVVGEQARTWIKLTKPEGSPTAQWLIFGADRGLAASAELPASVQLTTVKSGRAYGTHEDEFGNTIVVAYNILE